MTPLLTRLAEGGQTIDFTLDGQPAQARAGDTVLTAVLTQAERLRHTVRGHAPRAGFCLMSACQDCLVATEDGQRLRGCSTFIEPGMRLLTTR